MSHSLSASGLMWEPQLSALTDKYRVIRIDTRGHGQTEVPAGDYTLDQLADDLLGVMDALGIESAHYCGLSMGGMIGQTAALRALGRFKTLALCDTSSGYPPEMRTMWAERVKGARTNGLAATLDATIDHWFSLGFVQSAPDVIAGVKAMITATPVDGYCGCSMAISKLALTERLGEIAITALVIVGEDDQGTLIAMSEAIRDGIPGGQLVVLPVARHLSNMEDVEGFNKALRGFLDAH